MTTIKLSSKSLHALRIRKAKFGDKSYDETISHLLGIGHDAPTSQGGHNA